MHPATEGVGKFPHFRSDRQHRWTLIHAPAPCPAQVLAGRHADVLQAHPVQQPHRERLQAPTTPHISTTATSSTCCTGLRARPWPAAPHAHALVRGPVSGRCCCAARPPRVIRQSAAAVTSHPRLLQLLRKTYQYFHITKMLSFFNLNRSILLSRLHGHADKGAVGIDAALGPGGPQPRLVARPPPQAGHRRPRGRRHLPEPPQG